MTFLIYTVSLKIIQSIFFPKWRLLIFSGGNKPLTRHIWLAYLTPTPDFFHQNDRKGCTLEYLDGLGHFLFGFGESGKKSRGRMRVIVQTSIKQCNSSMNIHWANAKNQNKITRSISIIHPWEGGHSYMWCTPTKQGTRHADLFWDMDNWCWHRGEKNSSVDFKIFVFVLFCLLLFVCVFLTDHNMFSITSV